jgi:predicted MFS family arabinose efflux permease
MWGVTMMGYLFITGFVHLLIARIAAGVGEAGCKPPTYSLIGDYFSTSLDRTRALTVFWLGAPLAGMFAFGIGSLNEHVGWRLTFFIVGIPAILIALLAKTTLYEPRKNRSAAAMPSKADQPKISAVFKMLWRQHSTRYLCTAYILFYLGTSSVQWMGAFMMRIHGVGSAELGLWFGLFGGLGGMGGILFGGYAASRWFPGNEAGQMRMIAIVTALLYPVNVFLVLVGNMHLAFAAMITFFFMMNIFFGPMYSLLQHLVQDNVRATALAAVTLLTQFLGIGLGPQLVGIVSDLFAADYGVNSIRVAILIVSLSLFASSFFYWRLSRSVTADLRAVAAMRPSAA